MRDEERDEERDEGVLFGGINEEMDEWMKG